MMAGLHPLLELSAQRGSRQQASDGSMPPGHNGPWQERETPLRNTGNWLQLFLWSYERTGSPNLKQAAERAARFLLDTAHRPRGGAFLHRPDRPRQEGNGLIGQAWTLAALFAGFRILGWGELLATGQALLRCHDFDARLGLWSSLGLAGETLGLNLTLNQQVWFAAAALQDPQPDEETVLRIRRFLACLPSHVRLARSGRIEHRIHPLSLWRRFPAGWRSTLRSGRAQRSFGVERSVGYHAFVLHGLGQLVEQTSDDPGWDRRFVQRAMAYGQSALHREELRGNRFAYGYNPTGIEMAFANFCFLPGSDRNGEAWLGEQFGRCYDAQAGMMALNSPDPATLAGRICEAIRLPDMPVSLS